MTRILYPALALVIAGMVSAAAWRNAPEPLEITFAVPERVRSATVYVAHDKGYFDEEGLKVVLLPVQTGREAVVAIREGRADFAATAGMPVIESSRAGQPVSVLAAIANSDVHAGIVVLSASPITSYADLKGKRVGVIKGTTSELFLTTTIRAYAIPEASITFVPIAPPEAASVLKDGSVDAVSTAEPWLSRMVSDRAEPTRALAGNSNFFDYWFVVGPHATGPASDKERRLLRALSRANELVRVAPAEARAIVEQHVKVGSEEWSSHLFDLQLDDSVALSLQANARLTATPGSAPFLAQAVLRAEPLNAVKATSER